ncbi:hypothetical protein ACLWXS_001371 [Campylobacter jejuni]
MPIFPAIQARVAIALAFYSPFECLCTPQPCSIKQGFMVVISLAS